MIHFYFQVRYIGDYMNIIQKSNLNAQNIWSFMDMKKWLLASLFQRSRSKMDDYYDLMTCWNQGPPDGLQSHDSVSQFIHFVTIYSPVPQILK